MRKIIYLLIIILIIIESTINSYAVESRKILNDKKIIEIGWDTPKADYVELNIENMEKNNPFFDGLAIRTNKTTMFDKKLWTDEDLMIDSLKKISFSKYTDNFLKIEGSSIANTPDWFDDELWNNISKNTIKLSKAVKVGHCKGIIFDPEFYYPGVETTYSPWVFNYKGENYYKGKSFEEVTKKVYSRGYTFMKALQEENKSITVFFLAGPSIANDYCQGNIEELKNTPYALLPAFFDGMLEAANSGTKIIDGNEGGSYYIDETRRYALNYNYIKNAIKNIAVKNIKLEKNVQIGYAIYVDYVSGYLNQDMVNTTNREWEEEYYSMWMKHNIYQALLNTDKYVWVYSEKGSNENNQKEMDWWSFPSNNLPQKIKNDIQFANTRYENGLSLGFDMTKKDCWNPHEKAIFTENENVEITWKSFDEKSLNKVCVMAKVQGIAKEVEFYMDGVLIAEVKKEPYNIDMYINNKKYQDIYARVVYDEGKYSSSNIISLISK